MKHLKSFKNRLLDLIEDLYETDSQDLYDYAVKVQKAGYCELQTLEREIRENGKCQKTGKFYNYLKNLLAKHKGCILYSCPGSSILTLHDKNGTRAQLDHINIDYVVKWYSPQEIINLI